MPDIVHGKSSSIGISLLSRGVREFLMFTLAGDRYAVELARVREILRPPTLTPVPRAALDVIGVCSVRGLLVTVIDLRRRLRVLVSDSGRTSRILLTSTANDEVVGLFVDEVHHVVRLEGSEIEPAQVVLGGDAPDHVLGVGRMDDEVIVVLDLEGMVG
jgi:purine-binding chemotaxis protein CheW